MQADEPPPLPWWFVALVVVVGAVLRFIAESPLWLDEALSVHIAESNAIEDALRQDGHPPLYYVILGSWVDIVGDGDRAVRALSGIVSLAALPFAYLQGKRIGGERGNSIGGERLARLAVVVLAGLPFAIRYANETRMYALAILLTFAGWWMFDNARRKPTIERLLVVAVLVALLLYTHYWAIFLLGATGLWLLAAAVGRIPSFNKTAARRLIAAFVVGGVLFQPWVPALLDQAQNTGTPWAEPGRPATDIVLLLFELGGGQRSEAQLLAFLMVGLVVLGLFSRRDDSGLRFAKLQSKAVEPAAIIGVAFVVGIAAGAVSGSVFQPRYFAVLIPFFVILLTLGLDMLRGRVFVGVLAALLIVGFGMSAVEARTKRTQGADVAALVNAQATSDDIVIFCPDQLGPSTSRYLVDDANGSSNGPVLWTFPARDSPRTVDWRNYEERNRGSDPSGFAAETLEQAGDGTIWLVMSTTYRTYEGKCEILRDALAGQRTLELVVAGDPDVFEPATVFRYVP